MTSARQLAGQKTTAGSGPGREDGTARPITRVLGVILAGGLSSRMRGPEKSLLELGGKPLIAHAIDRLRPQVDSVVINANGDAGRFAEFQLPVVADLNDDRAGPLAGVLAGMNWGRENGFSHVVTVAGDTPFFPANLAERLKARAEDMAAPIALAASEAPGKGLLRHPTFGFWPVSLADDLARALAAGTRKVVFWTDRHSAATTEFDHGLSDPFFNVNRPEDLAVAERLLKARVQ